ncbi:MAG: serine/threonine-protein kinase [Deltaproteobacteria bacterium]|nr:serine/threonine-protein kinase [Deltaproteobacteria bacterium]
MDSQDLPRPFGPFTLLRLIAQGGMGAVFLALRPVPADEAKKRKLPDGQEEVCVVKTVRSDLKADREAVGRFLDEARVVQKLHHVRIARTIDAGIIDKTYFLGLEFISGRNLRDVHTRAQKLGRTLPEELIVHVVGDMLEALEHAHALVDKDTGRALNIVHRDVSPHNVMLGFDGNTKLIDFGLAAHELKRELTRPGVMVGKLRYNAPEQVRDKALDGRSDVYSAAVVLYEFIANERFYEGLPEEQVWRVAMKGDHRPRSWRDIDEEWRHLLDVALQNDPEKRYRSAGEFRDALLDVAEARGIDLKNMRREASKFMRDAFGAEQAQEREMILQATGIAEARTRLFRSPSEMQSALGNLGASRSGPEVKTEIFDPAAMGGRGAEHLRELQNMMSRLADPNAETQLPGDPVQSDLSGAEGPSDTFHVDASADGSSLSSAAESAFDAPLARTTRNPSFNNSDVPPTVAGRRGPRVSDVEAELDRPSAPAATPATNSAMRRAAASRSAPQPLPPLPPKKKAGSPLLALFGGLVVVALLGAVAIVVVPLFLKPRAQPLQPDNEGVVDVVVVDGGSASAAVVDAGPAAVAVFVATDAGVAAVPVVVDAGFLLEDPPEPPPTKKKIIKAKTPPPPPPPPPPPQRMPKSFKEQVDYLRQYCLARVACARSVVGSAGSVMSLTTDELRSLKEAAPKCVERCQR